MPDLKSKPLGVLAALKQELTKGFITGEYEVLGHKFKLKTLSEDDETWADTYVRNVSAMSLISSRKTPRLAAAIIAIDDTPVDKLFEYSDDINDKIKKELDENPLQRRYWMYNQMFMFLNEDANRRFVNLLYAKYEELEETAAKAVGEVSN